MEKRIYNDSYEYLVFLWVKAQGIMIVTTFDKHEVHQYKRLYGTIFTGDAMPTLPRICRYLCHSHQPHFLVPNSTCLLNK